MLANNMVMPVFRLWTHTMHLPKQIMNVLASHLHAFIWNKECFFEGDEMGTESRNQTWVSQEARNHLIREREGGLSLLNCISTEGGFLRRHK